MAPDLDPEESRAPAESGTLWAGRLDAEPAEALMSFTVSLPYDRLLAADDIAASHAHVRGLVRAGLLSEADGVAVATALDVAAAELATGEFAFAPGDEDIHTAVERRVTELAGDAGARLHTARSRNDQVACDLRLFVKRELAAVAGGVLSLQQVLAERAAEAGEARLPAYTHLQRAQPVLLAHHLMAHGWALARDFDRLLDARRRADVSPLGAGASAGTSLPIDPDATAADLGFAARFENSLDAVSDRDFVAESLFALALLGVHLSRLGEEIVWWASEEVGFLRLDDAWATGSSMMPQKKNPDVAELARARAGRLIGNLTGLLATLKGLPLAYNRDLQEDKEPLFDSLAQVRGALAALAGLLRSAAFDEARMAAAADDPFLAATDLAEVLVSRGVPFRAAHERIAGVVQAALAGEGSFADLAAAEVGPEALAVLQPGGTLARRTSLGGGGPAAVAVQRERFGARLAADAARVAALDAPPA
ncbi:MAG: argininosuccinate lyase [bacterium]|nr:argininosuccinate lyase [bacterium]